MQEQFELQGKITPELKETDIEKSKYGYFTDSVKGDLFNYSGKNLECSVIPIIGACSHDISIRPPHNKTTSRTIPK